ncbi:DUF2889 domain-containing protein [Pseudomonas sp. H9]|uniref:DUF2889 domain-containing protein n=1 Tax=Pseudomonas sp. H9 TaxID=483968 RepID=UPI0010581B89|nr:DUF2889 domain-containing protein [Pseudomonas sp. H9]TDF83817.1 DUF2889 domain-containing protein [Pseudomonas sp. H9]
MNSTPVSRDLVHTREIICQGFRRSDGLVDIEGRLQDIANLKSDTPYHPVEIGEALHDMRLVMTLDSDMVIQAITAYTDTGATPICDRICPAYTSLNGLRIGPGFKQQVKARVGGVQGCTHLTELLERMASAAMQVRFTLARAERCKHPQSAQAPIKVNSWVIDTCHAYRSDSELVRQIATSDASPPDAKNNN